MARSREETDYSSLTETLINTFGTVLSRDVIYTIVESCSGDLNYAANAIMSIINESDIGLDSRWTEVQNSSVNNQPNIQQDDREYIIDNKVVQPTAAPLEINATIHNAPSNDNVGTMSYAQASMLNNSKQSSRQSTKSPMKTVPTDRIYDNNIWTETIRRIVTYHNKGTRTLIFMRGAPGSGKSYLARQIVEITVGASVEHLHIFSTDDFFMQNGVYSFEKMWLSDAHAWNHKRAAKAMEKGVSPIIIDNTNIKACEMLPYVKQGVQRGYVIEIVEPDTPWSRKLSQLTVRNTHDVPRHRIQRMLDSLDTIKYEDLLHDLKIVYPTNMQPPVLRCFPEIMPNYDNSSINVDSETIEGEQSAFLQHDNNAVVNIDAQVDDHVHSVAGIENSTTSFECTNQVKAQDYPMFADNFDGSTHNECQNIILLPDSEVQVQAERQLDTEERMQINITVDNIEHYNNNDDTEEPFESNDNTENENKESPQSSAVKCTPVKEYELNYNKLLEDFERVENEWENGEAWDEDIKPVSSSANNKSDFMISSEAKPPREKKSQLKVDLSFVNNDWRKITMFMPSFTENSDPPVGTKQNLVETTSTETSMEIGDTDIYKNQYKVISAVNRDINLNYVPNLSEKVPKNPMLDKSSMTNEPTNIAKNYRCKNEDKHFVRFRNMFKNLNKDDLRYIFDKCCGDVNWAVSIVLDDMATNKIEPVRGDERSDTEDENEEPCECTAHYDIIPDITPTRIADEVDENVSVAVPSTSRNSNNGTPAVVKKQKKDAPLSDTSLALKRQIEQNIIMSGEYNSINYVKARKLRYQQMYGNLDNSEAMDNSNSENTETISFDVVNTDTSNQDNNTPSALEDVDTECDSDNDSGLIDVEKTVNINIGYEFLGQLDKLFGRGDMVYSENIEPRINMPISLLNEINALWMESLMYQLESESKVHEDIVKQDEKFARELASKEEEVRKSGKESEVPNLKEVMDLEFALALYRKDCEEWQKDRPTDIAAKLSAQKLYNLFPEIPHRDLDEIHMAHHNDFQATVGVLLMSSGRSDLVEDENGINKFVMAGELQRQQKILNEEKEKLQNEIEWPALPSRITLDVVNNYRNEAETHLQNRQMSFGKAQDYMSRGMPMVASFYSDIARLHTLKYEQAQSIAAASLIQFHTERYENSETLDLHYLRVAEAREALDIFLDTHIQHLRENIGKKNVTLYFITGRGLHSTGGPKVKPAVKRRLRERNLGYCERNPGLLTVKVCAGDMLSYQIT